MCPAKRDYELIRWHRSQALSITLTPEHYKRLESVLPFDIGFPTNFNGVSPIHGGAPTFNITQSGHYDWVAGAQPVLPFVKKTRA